MFNFDEDDGDPSSSFFVFQHTPYHRGNQCEDTDSDVFSHLYYQYPKSFPRPELECFLNAIVSLFTFTTLSIGDDEVQLLSFDLYKIAIHTYFIEDGSCVFLILRLTSDFPDGVVSQTLENIHKGLFFVLGNSFIKSEPQNILKSFLAKEGNRIFNEILNPNNLTLFHFTFPTVQKVNWDTGAIAVSLTFTKVIKTSPKIWGVSCFINNKLLISQIPLSVCMQLIFLPLDKECVSVYLTKSQKEDIQNFPMNISEIPDGEIIETNLYVFKDSMTTFYVFTDPKIPDDIISKAKNTFEMTMKFVSENFRDSPNENAPSDTITYDNDLCTLLKGKTTETFDENAVIAHDYFFNDHRLKEVIMRNSYDFTICYRALSFEHFAFAEDNGRTGFSDLYDTTINLNPNLRKFIETMAPSEAETEKG